MLKPTRAKVIVFLTIVTVSFAPLLLIGSGPAVILPIMQIFWLAFLAGALGIPVTSPNAPDAFRLAAPNVIGGVLVIAGLAISLAAQYLIACFLVTLFSTRK